jgi:formate hydrogenlyase subunit 4
MSRTKQGRKKLIVTYAEWCALFSFKQLKNKACEIDNRSRVEIYEFCYYCAFSINLWLIAFMIPIQWECPFLRRLDLARFAYVVHLAAAV